MNVLTKVLEKEVQRLEKNAEKMSNQKYRLTYHLMPPTGWLNDPNGLCFFKGRYHVFFQYAPTDVNGGIKLWGHYSSSDLIHWDYEGAPLLPDTPEDCHGVYSGSALVENDKMHLFYTGNVKLEGDYDYINNGRQASTIHVCSDDGVHFGRKTVVIPHSQFPSTYTCHIRDPKVWKENDIYYMIQGGRLKVNQGTVMLFRSKDLQQWELFKEMTTKKPFGYMWECPDYFRLDGQKILSVSPQGVSREEYRYQNLYQSGYFILDDEQVAIDSETFRQWDYGYDFYAPQTFEDEKGRRILIGWMGMPDAEDEYRNLTMEEGWQHCLTVPRELIYNHGKIYQTPVEELKTLRKEERAFGAECPYFSVKGAFELEIAAIEGKVVTVSMGNDLTIHYEAGEISFIFSDAAGAGRKCRKVYLNNLKHIRILKDTSAVEIYLNEGEMVFSSRYYPKDMETALKIQANEYHGKLWKLRKGERDEIKCNSAWRIID